MLSDLISSAFNSGVSKVEKAIEEKMSSVAGNMNLGNMKFPFKLMEKNHNILQTLVDNIKQLLVLAQKQHNE